MGRWVGRQSCVDARKAHGSWVMLQNLAGPRLTPGAHRATKPARGEQTEGSRGREEVGEHLLNQRDGGRGVGVGVGLGLRRSATVMSSGGLGGRVMGSARDTRRCTSCGIQVGGGKYGWVGKK